MSGQIRPMNWRLSNSELLKLDGVDERIVDGELSIASDAFMCETTQSKREHRKRVCCPGLKRTATMRLRPLNHSRSARSLKDHIRTLRESTTESQYLGSIIDLRYH